VILYPSRAVDTGKTFHFQDLLTSPKVTRLYLDELDLPEDASLSVRLVKLITAPVTEAIALAQQLVAQTYREITQRQQQVQWLDLLETIMVYELPALSREEIQQMMGLSDIDLKQTRFYQDVFAEGEAEGRQEGRQEGKQEEGTTIILRLLRRRFELLEPALESQIRALTLTQIEVLVEAFLDFSQVENLEAWLQRGGTQAGG